MFADDDYEDPEASELRAEARAERRRNAYHWCSTCHGRGGEQSPCRDGPDKPENESEDEGETA